MYLLILRWFVWIFWMVFDNDFSSGCVTYYTLLHMQYYILYIIYYYLCMFIFPHCMFTVFSFLRAVFFFCALFPLSLDLFEYDSQTGQFMNHSYSTCCTSFETHVHFHTVLVSYRPRTFQFTIKFLLTCSTNFSYFTCSISLTSLTFFPGVYKIKCNETGITWFPPYVWYIKFNSEF